MNGRMKLNEFDELTIDKKLSHIYERMVGRDEFIKLKIKMYSIGGAILLASAVIKWVVP